MSRSFVYIGNMKAGTQLAGKLVEAGFQPASEVESADCVVTYLVSVADQEDAYFGTDGIIARALPGTVLVDLSPTTPTFARELSAMAAVNDLHMVEAPLYVEDLTLPDAFSRTGNLSLFVAGDSADVAAAEPVLAALSASQQRCGATGQAQVARCVASMVRASQAASLAEAYALAASIRDARPDSFARAVAACGLPAWAESLASAIQQRTFDGAYTVEMVYGELASALDAAEDEGVVTPHAEAAEYLLELMSLAGAADMSVAALCLAYSDDEASSEYGLDWSRVEEVYEHMAHEGHDHDHGHDGDYDNGGDYGYDDYDVED